MKKINYEGLCRETKAFFTYLDQKLLEILRFELPEEITDELEAIRDLLRGGYVEFRHDVIKNPHKYIYQSYIENLLEIKECLKTILFITGKEGKHLSRLPEMEKEHLLEEKDLPFLPDDWEGISEELRAQFLDLKSKIKLLERKSQRYFLTDKDRYADYEEEVGVQ